MKVNGGSKLFNTFFKLSRKSGLINFFFKRFYGCDIPRKVQIGDAISLPHGALGTVIHPDAIIGNNVCVQHHVLLGQRNGGGTPIIKDNVILNPYCIVIGNVTIGENSIIGAGSIITKDVPPNSIYYNKVTPIIKELHPKDRESKI